MNEKIKNVLRGYFNLTEEERVIFLREIERSNRLTYLERARNEAEVKRLGPTSTAICSCCGK